MKTTLVRGSKLPNCDSCKQLDHILEEAPYEASLGFGVGRGFFCSECIVKLKCKRVKKIILYEED